MRGSSLGYLIKEGAKNLYVNRLMSFASIGTLVACMLLIGSSMLFSMNVNSIVGYVEQQNDIPVILSDGLSQQDMERVDREIDAIENIYEITFVSKDELLSEYTSDADMSELFSMLENDNPLFDSYVVRVQDQSQMASTVMQLEAIDGVAEVRAPSDVPEIVTSIKRAVAIAGTMIVAILLLVSLVIIANTIKVTIFNRRKEINIMKYVGATDMFIRLPYFVEGFLLGLLSASIAFFLLWGGYNYIMDAISLNTLTWFQQAYASMIPFDSVALEMFGYFACGGIGVGVFGSVFFVSKYLKV